DCPICTGAPRDLQTTGRSPFNECFPLRQVCRSLHFSAKPLRRMTTEGMEEASCVRNNFPAIIMDPGAARANKECVIFSNLKVVGPEWLVLESKGVDPQYIGHVGALGRRMDETGGAYWLLR